MMTVELETQVVQTLEQLLQKYQQIDQLADKMLVDNTPIEYMDEKMVLINQQRESAAKLMTHSQSLRDQYLNSNKQASPRVRQLTNMIGNLMQNLLMKISKLEKLAKESGAQLVPQIQQGVRAAQMKNAYARYK